MLTIDPDGRSRKIWLQPDGTWTGLSRRGLAGKWMMSGAKICLASQSPASQAACAKTFPTEPGVSVDAKDPTGKTVQVKLVKGHVTK